jgi:subtilisin family serine protease
MHVFDARRDKVELIELGAGAELDARLGMAAEALLVESPVAKAHRAFFELGRGRGPLRAARVAPPPPGPPPSSFKERDTGLVRTFHRELVLRFRERTAAAARKRILESFQLEVRRTNAFVAEQVVVRDKTRRRAGGELIEIANQCAALDEVVFATPNFVSEYRRQLAKIPAAQWHLDNLGTAAGQRKGEDVGAKEAWKLTRGKRDVVVAVLDDGVDVDHPNLQANVWRATGGKDRVGRDFFLPDDHPDHYNPRPKKFRFPFDDMPGNDIHGTPCAGVIAAAGGGAVGIAPRCRVLAVKIFHADELASDERVADAIRYAARRAGVISCSWSSATSPDVQLALEDARKARGGRGVAVFCATGNESSKVAFPARDPLTIAVGASTDQAKLAGYSNTGPQVDVVAPSSGGVREIFTTDVSVAGRGFNVGRAAQGGKDGLHTNSFGGTSSATPLAAGIAALMLSVHPKLSAEEVREIQRGTADKIGDGYDAAGFSPRFGCGRVNAAQAVAEAKKRAKG